jgi:hypothetical protein
MTMNDTVAMAVAERALENNDYNDTMTLLDAQRAFANSAAMMCTAAGHIPIHLTAEFAQLPHILKYCRPALCQELIHDVVSNIEQIVATTAGAERVFANIAALDPARQTAFVNTLAPLVTPLAQTEGGRLLLKMLATLHGRGLQMANFIEELCACCAHIACQAHGPEVLLAFIHNNTRLGAALATTIARRTRRIIENRFGHELISAILDTPYLRTQHGIIAAAVAANVADWSTHCYSSKIVDRFTSWTESQHSHTVRRALLTSPHLAAVAADMYGNYVVQNLAACCDLTEQTHIIQTLKSADPQLQTHIYSMPARTSSCTQQQEHSLTNTSHHTQKTVEDILDILHNYFF